MIDKVPFTRRLAASPARSTSARPIIYALALAAAGVWAPGRAVVLAADAIPARGAKVVEVTVYPDRAEVVREARIEAPAGGSTAEFAGLPWQVEADSLRVTARGVPAVIGAVELREKADPPQESAELVAARDEVKRLEGELAALASEDGTAKDLRDFLNALRAATARNESEKLGEGRPDPGSIQAVFGLLKTNLETLQKEALSRQQRREKLTRDLEVARARLATARPAGAIWARVASIEIDAKQAGALTLRLAYLAPGASWRPSYRAALDAATGEVSLVSEAVVRQTTGEDWDGVALTLSTASPARGVQPPVLTSWLLRPVESYALAQGGFAKVAAEHAREGTFMSNLNPEAPRLAPGVADSPEEAATESETREAGIVHSAYNVAFQVPGRSEVPADGADHRVVLRQESLAGKVEYRTVPSANPAAFLVAKTTTPAEYPLLAGPVRVFAGGAYLGLFGLPETSPRAEVTLPFGVDNRVKVERILLPQSRTQEGFTGKERRIAFAFRTTVENLRDQKVTVVVEDRIPVSEDERIQVEPGKGTTPGWAEDEDRPGVHIWTLALEPKQKREITLEYAVRHPKDLPVPGL